MYVDTQVFEESPYGFIVGEVQTTFMWNAFFAGHSR